MVKWFRSERSFHIDRKSKKGFTLIEILVVMTILGILVTLAIPSYRLATLKAREAALKENLFIFRDVLDQYYSDHGSYPPSLEELVEMEYLRSIPVDPITRAKETWVEVYLEDTEGDEEGGIFDVQSGSDQTGTDGTPYREW